MNSNDINQCEQQESTAKVAEISGLLRASPRDDGPQFPNYPIGEGSNGQNRLINLAMTELDQARRERNMAIMERHTANSQNQKLADALSKAGNDIEAQASHIMMLERRIREMAPEKQFRVQYIASRQPGRRPKTKVLKLTGCHECGRQDHTDCAAAVSQEVLYAKSDDGQEVVTSLPRPARNYSAEELGEILARQEQRIRHLESTSGKGLQVQLEQMQALLAQPRLCGRACTRKVARARGCRSSLSIRSPARCGSWSLRWIPHGRCHYRTSANETQNQRTRQGRRAGLPDQARDGVWWSGRALHHTRQGRTAGHHHQLASV